MQQVPNAECGDSTSASASPSASTHAGGARWSRIPRVQLLRNKTDQRVPLSIDQTVPVWPAVRRSHSSNARGDKLQSSNNTSSSTTSSTSSGGLNRGVMRKFAGISQTVWFRSIKGVLKSSHTHHACNVSEILRECSCGKWSGIEQDLFTCTSVDPKLFRFAPPDFFTSNKKSKGKSQIDH